MSNDLQTAVFGGGCFWCTEAVFQQLKGVESVISGYAGGVTETPAYEEVSSGTSGHAEVIKVEFDPKQISYADLLNVFFATHDPTTLNQQGADTGIQYRSVIMYVNDDQKEQAEQFVQKLEDEEVFDNPIVTQVEPLNKFYSAEEYHLNYYKNNPDKPYCQVVISPKIGKLRQRFANLIRQ